MVCRDSVLFFSGKNMRLLVKIILFLTRENKIHIFRPPIFFLSYKEKDTNSLTFKNYLEIQIKLHWWIKSVLKLFTIKMFPTFRSQTRTFFRGSERKIMQGTLFVSPNNFLMYPPGDKPSFNSLTVCTNKKAGNYVINIHTTEDTENTPLNSWM